MKLRHVALSGVGGYLPGPKVANDYFEKYLDTTDEWIRRRTGIKTRYFANAGSKVSELALPAASQAINRAGLTADDIELIIFATTTPDCFMPATACLLQQILCANTTNTCPAFDVQAVCTGFVYGVSIGAAMIAAGTVDNALVIGADIYSRLLDMQDRSTCILFGDGAGAAVLIHSEQQGIEAVDLHADGKLAGLITTSGSIVKNQVADKIVFAMDGPKVYKAAVQTMIESAQKVCAQAGCSTQDIDWLVVHQANLRIIDSIAKAMDIDTRKVVRTVTEHANTSAASIPLGLNSIWDKIQPGERVLLTAAGGGFTWGSVLWQA